MRLQELNTWLALATNVAVVLGIVFLVIEIQQNTVAIRGQSSLAINDSLAHLNEAIYSDPDFARIWDSGRQSLSNLDSIERQRFTAYMLERLNLAVYSRELERSGAGDVHIDWIQAIEDEIRDNPGICEFVSIAGLQGAELWSAAVSDCNGRD